MCVYNNWVIKLLILRLHFRLISGWRGNNPTREKMRTLVSLSYNMAKVVLIIVEPERITLFPPIASLLYLLDENMRRDGVSPWRRSICYSSRGVEAYSSSSNSSRVYYCDVDGRTLLDCRALIGLLSLARTVHMTTVLCINRQKETHQQTLVPNGYCHFFLSVVHLSHQMYKRISLGHHFPLKNPNILGFKFEMQFLKEMFSILCSEWKRNCCLWCWFSFFYISGFTIEFVNRLALLHATATASK